MFELPNARLIIKYIPIVVNTFFSFFQRGQKCPLFILSKFEIFADKQIEMRYNISGEKRRDEDEKKILFHKEFGS